MLIFIFTAARDSTSWTSVRGVASDRTLLARHGVTSYFPTTVTAPMDATLRALERLANAIEKREVDRDLRLMEGKRRALALGIHLEGPFLSHARRGVHPPEYLLAPTLPLFEQFWQAARGRIRMMTIAPELEGALEVIAEAARRGVCVSLGHSDADFAAAERGITAERGTLRIHSMPCVR
jgi:N-acetylglucosamine-6-phosphate deacetylase